MHPKINLFINYYNIAGIRGEEIKDTLNWNLQTKIFDKIFAVIDFKTIQDIQHPSLEYIVQANRPTFQDFLSYASIHKDKCNIVANTDIMFDASLLKIFELLTSETVIELSRYEANSQIVNSGEDVWCFLGEIKPVNCNFNLGVLGCDWLFTTKLKEAGYKVLNPSLDIMTWHNHSSQIRTYDLNKSIHDPKRDNFTKPMTIQQCKELLLS